MKFRLAKVVRYWWPVTFTMPDPVRPGERVEQRLQVQFAARDREAVVAAYERYQTLSTERERVEHEHAEIRAIVTNWDDVVDDAGDPVAFSAEALEAALQQVWFRRGVLAAYGDSLASQTGEAGRLGN